MIALAIAGGIAVLFLLMLALCLAAIAGEADRRLAEHHEEPDVRDALNEMGREAELLDFRRTVGGWRI